MPQDLESLRDQMNRLERQLRVFQIAAVVLAVLAIAFALAPSAGVREPGSNGFERRGVAFVLRLPAR